MKPTSQFKAAQSGFSLIELLVVIAVIAVLAALLLPGLAKAKATARTTACKSNLRQQGVGLRFFLDDNEKYPFWQAWTDEGRQAWDTSILQLTANESRIFLCPAMKISLDEWCVQSKLWLQHLCYRQEQDRGSWIGS